MKHVPSAWATDRRQFLRTAAARVGTLVALTRGAALAGQDELVAGEGTVVISAGEGITLGAFHLAPATLFVGTSRVEDGNTNRTARVWKTDGGFVAQSAGGIAQRGGGLITVSTSGKFSLPCGWGQGR